MLIFFSFLNFKRSFDLIHLPLFMGKMFQMRVDKLSSIPLLGGSEVAFKKKFNEQENTFSGIELWTKSRCCAEANLYATDRRLFSAIWNRSNLFLKKFMDKRLEDDKNARKHSNLLSNL